MDTITSTALSTAAQLLPTILLASAGSAPGVASAAALAPVALQLLQSATQFANAGVMTHDQLAALFTTIGANIKASHDQWVTMGSPTAT